MGDKMSQIPRLDEVLDATSKVDSVKLRELAGYYSDESALSQEDETIKMAMITYCLHKIFIKMHMREKTEPVVESALRNLSSGALDALLKDLEAFDRENGMFEGGLVGKAKIKIASRLHSRGISLTQSASLTGAPIGEILDYVGETRGYQYKEGRSALERLNIARDIFKDA